MNTIKRTLLQKLKILLFHKDVRVTQGGVYSEVRSFDFSSYYPESDYIQYSEPPLENVYDIRDFGARAGDEGFDCAPAINAAIKAACATGGTVLVRDGEYTTTEMNL